MDNLAKYKLSQFKDIRTLNEDCTAILSYNISDDKAYVIKYTDIEKKPIYDKIQNIKCNNMPEIYDIIEDNDKCIIIEKYIKGLSLERLIKERGPLKEKTACKYILDICQALRAVHSLNIIHRDISPDNVIIDENDNAILLDFDIAREGSKNKSTDTTILGTAGFASPEQYGFAQTDVRSDIYSLGALFNYMLTGYIPQRLIYGKKPLYSIIKKATQIDPFSRYSNIYEFQNAIAEYNNGSKEFMSKPGYVYNEGNKQNLPKRILRHIPGFRTNVTAKKIIACTIYVIYILIVISSIDMYVDKNGAVVMSLFFALIYIVPMWWFGNNGKLWDKIPVMNRFDKKWKIISAIGIYIAVVFLFFTIIPVPEIKLS